MAEAASEHELQTDIDYLHKLWSDIWEKSSAAGPGLLYQDLNLSYRVLRDFVNDDTVRILVDSCESYQKMKGFAEAYMVEVMGRIDDYAGERPLFDLYGVEEHIEKALPDGLT